MSNNSVYDHKTHGKTATVIGHYWNRDSSYAPDGYLYAESINFFCKSESKDIYFILNVTSYILEQEYIIYQINNESLEGINGFTEIKIDTIPSGYEDKTFEKITHWIKDNHSIDMISIEQYRDHEISDFSSSVFKIRNFGNKYDPYIFDDLEKNLCIELRRKLKRK